MNVGHIFTFVVVFAGAVFGAEGGGLWSISPVGNPVPPQSETGNPIDGFVREWLEENGLKPAPLADRRTLIRRASYDLLGLQPTAEEVEAFVADSRPDAEAFGDVVDRFLDSKHYGEQWGRHWLDVARYADTAGENSDHPLPHAWRYRNWVIDAFNDDKPYDRFVREQIAGDILAKDLPAEERAAGVIATGYLAIARRFGHDSDKEMHLTYEDVIDNLGKAFLGLTISCARCHDHKHDPISARDYYALYGVFQSTRFSFPGCEAKQQPRDLYPIASGDVLEKKSAWEKRRDELNAELAAFEETEKAKSEALKELAAKSLRLVSKGDVPDGGSIVVSREPIEVKVRKGEAIQLSILPRGNYGADTTVVDFSITHVSESGEVRWSVKDLIDDLTKGNPLVSGGATWCFLDTKGGEMRLLGERHESVQNQPSLKSWEDGKAPPSVFANTSGEPVKVWTTLPPRTFFVHPGPEGPVAIAWLSPIEGNVRIDLTVSDGHPGGDGVGWLLEHFASPEIAASFEGMGASGAIRNRVAEHAGSEPVVPVAYAVSDGEAKAAKLQRRGDPEDLGEEIPRGYLSILGGGQLGDARSSGRLELAERIADKDNPLTARVMVNRIWAWHFGRGIVATPNDFGNHGAQPTQPDLLDYLARKFMDSGWSVKAMHRLIMGSGAYRQTAGDGADYGCVRVSRRRLTAEELRDTLLVAAGELDRAPAVGHAFPEQSAWKFTQHAPFADEYPTKKRSVYVMRKRNRTGRFFALFDGADPNASTAGRAETVAPTQALYFMNDPFFHASGEKFAERIRGAAPDAKGRLDFAYREIFGRPVREEDVAAFDEFAIGMGEALDGNAEEKDREIWNSYSRVLLGSNELLHID